MTRRTEMKKQNGRDMLDHMRINRILADTAYLAHCANHFMEALKALKQISKETIGGIPTLGAQVAKGYLEKLEAVEIPE